MAEVEQLLCLACAGHLAWFPEVSGYRHTWTPEGTLPHAAHPQRAEHGFVEEVVESDIDTGRRIEAAREEIEARGAQMRRELGDFDLSPTPRHWTPREDPKFEMRVGTDLDGSEFRYPWLIEPTWINADGSEVRVTPGTGARSAAKKTERLDEHPPPEVPARPCEDWELPPRARAVRDLMLEYGWTARQLYARGSKSDRYLREAHMRLIDTVVLLASRPPNRERVIASWVDSGYDLGLRLIPGNHHRLSATELTATIKAAVLQCTTCGEPPHTHPLPASSPTCFQEEHP